MPAVGSNPFADILIRGNLTAVHTKKVYGLLRRVIRKPRSSGPCLLVFCAPNSVFERFRILAEGVAERLNLRTHPALNESFGLFGFKFGIETWIEIWALRIRIFVVYGMASDFVPSLRHASEGLYVVRVPLDLSPIGAFVPGGLIGDQEKCSCEGTSVKNGDGSFELTSQAVVESERDECWFSHICDVPSRARKPGRRPTQKATPKTRPVPSSLETDRSTAAESHLPELADRQRTYLLPPRALPTHRDDGRVGRRCGRRFRRRIPSLANLRRQSGRGWFSQPTRQLHPNQTGSTNAGRSVRR